jgi:hypothetical protein
VQDRSSTSTGRSLAFRIVGWLLGVGTILFGLAFVLGSFVSDDPVEETHRFHYLAIATGNALIGVFSIVWVLRPGWTAAFHVLVSQAVAWLIGGLMGGDVVLGFYVTGVIGVVVLWALHPEPRSQLRLPGRPSVALLILALIGTIPAWIYAVTNAELQHGPVTDPHVELHHWSGIAVAALSIAGAGIASSLRGVGWEIASAATALAAVVFGLAGLVFSDLPGAPAVEWSWVAIAAGVAFWLLARIEAAREPATT